MKDRRPFLRVTLLTPLIFVSCLGVARAAEYYGADNSNAVYIAWTESAGRLSGQMIFIHAETENRAKFQTDHSEIRGARSGSDVTLETTLWGTITGHIGWSSLSVVIPSPGVPVRITLHAGSFDDFQAVAQRLQSSVASARGRQDAYAGVVEAINNITDARSNVARALADINHLVPIQPEPGGLRLEYPDKYSAMEQAWHKEQVDASVQPMTCWQKNTVQWDSDSVAYELGSVQYLDASYANLNYQINSDAAAVRRGLAALSTWVSIYDQRASTYSNMIGQARPQSPSGQAQAFKRRSLATLSTLIERFATVTTTKDDYDQRSAELKREAKIFASEIRCSE